MKISDLIKTNKQRRDELLPILEKFKVDDNSPFKVSKINNLYIRQQAVDLLMELFPEKRNLTLLPYLRDTTYNELIEEINRRAEL